MNFIRSFIGSVSVQGIWRASVTHAPGPFRHLCTRSGPRFFLTLLPTSFSQLPTSPPGPLDQASSLPPTPRSSRWERGVGGRLARDVALNGGGRGGQLFIAKPRASEIESHPQPHPRGGSRTRPGADDLRDEALNHPANHFPTTWKRSFTSAAAK